MIDDGEMYITVVSLLMLNDRIDSCASEESWRLVGHVYVPDL